MASGRLGHWFGAQRFGFQPDMITFAKGVTAGHAALGNVTRNEPLMRDALDSLRDISIVGDIRGAGHFWAIELVKDQRTKETFEGEEADWLLRQVLSGELVDAGLLCRLDDRGDPVLQLSPPLICDMDLFNEIVDIVRVALRTAAKLVEAGDLG